MTSDLSNVTANFGLDQIYDTKFPVGATVTLRTGAPTGAENAAGGSLLATITLPASPWSAAASGSKAKNGSWAVAASGTGVAGNYRLIGTTTTNIEEGTVGLSASDMILDNTNIVAAQNVAINTFTRTL
jgi:hypothetical protein